MFFASPQVSLLKQSYQSVGLRLCRTQGVAARHTLTVRPLQNGAAPQKEEVERKGRKRMRKEDRAATMAQQLADYCANGPPDAPAFDAEREAADAVEGVVGADVVLTTYTVGRVPLWLGWGAAAAFELLCSVCKPPSEAPCEAAPQHLAGGRPCQLLNESGSLAPRDHLR